MVSAVSIQPSAIFSLAAISPVAFQNLSGGSAVAALDSPSSIVEVSLVGQVLAAGSTLADELAALQPGSTSATPAGVSAEVQDFVTDFNALQQGIANVGPLLGTQTDGSLIAQLSQTLNAAGTALGGAGSLQGIGVRAASVPSSGPSGSTVSLVIDPNALNAAASADPAGVLAQLAGATRPLQQQLGLFESQASLANALPGATASSGTALPGSGVPTSLLQQLPADTVLNAIQLTDLDLAAVGLDANSLQSNNGVRESSLAALIAASVVTPTPLTGVLPQPVSVAASSRSAATATPAASAPASPAAASSVATASPPTATTTPSAATPTTPPTDAQQAAAQSAAEQASLAQQGLAADPLQQALANLNFNPAYAALMASAHPNDFIGAQAALAVANLGPERPAPVRSIDRVMPIGGDNGSPENAFGQQQTGESRRGARDVRNLSGRSALNG